MKTFFVFLLFIPFFCFSQNIDSCAIICSNTVLIQAHFINDNSKERTEMGAGIIINGNYLSTCYHVINPKPNERLKNIFYTYNIRVEKNTYVCDTGFLTTKFKAKKHQYDFSKHIYDSTNYETDFVILKLLKPIKKQQIVFANTLPKYSERLYCRGSTMKNNRLFDACQSVIFGFNYQQSQNQTAYFLGCMGPFTFGFSGGALYNSKGEIIGFIQFSFITSPYDYIKYQYENHLMSKDLANTIINGYQQGYFLQFSINAEYVVEKYLKGYLD